MAKKAMIEKWSKEPKFSTRKYNRCKICGRPHGYIRKFDIVKYYDGLLLRVPNRQNPEVLEEVVKQEKCWKYSKNIVVGIRF